MRPPFVTSTAKDNVYYTLTAIQRLLAEPELPAAVILVQVEALATYAVGQLALVQETQRPRRLKTHQ